MKIEHIAVWAEDIELLRAFYMNYFDMACSKRYFNRTKDFTSYFLSFGEGDSRIELMHIPDMETPADRAKIRGLAHIAISVGSMKAVDRLTERFATDGHTIISRPRTTGDGYYESVIADPEGNRIEITV